MTSSSPKVDIWMPVYVGDYLASTGRLTTEQHGAYFLLLLDYWKNGPPPDDDSILCQIARLSLESWKEIRHSMSSFFRISGGQWKHQVLDERREEAERNRQNAINRGRRGAEARYRTRGGALTIDGAVFDPSMEDGSTSSSSPSSSTLPSSVSSAPNQTLVEGKLKNRRSEKFQLFWNLWPKDKLKIKRADAEKLWISEGLDEHCDEILDHVRLCLTGEQWHNGYVPIPFNYLDKKRWLDGEPKQFVDPFRRRII